MLRNEQPCRRCKEYDSSKSNAVDQVANKPYVTVDKNSLGAPSPFFVEECSPPHLLEETRLLLLQPCIRLRLCGERKQGGIQ